ncbi:unnamed protein product [Symbiodinium sp. CCMP2592]|nr:unnamed protein product [Symbiodinium sp. CCMP2592]CAE7832487.1 unnamed protein product [Symbiodinium sp. CCMP2592]
MMRQKCLQEHMGASSLKSARDLFTEMNDEQLADVRNKGIQVYYANGDALYVPAGWIFAERILGSAPWVGVRAGVLCDTLGAKQDLEWLAKTWCRDDELMKVMLNCLTNKLVGAGTDRQPLENPAPQEPQGALPKQPSKQEAPQDQKGQLEKPSNEVDEKSFKENLDRMEAEHQRKEHEKQQEHEERERQMKEKEQQALQQQMKDQKMKEKEQLQLEQHAPEHEQAQQKPAAAKEPEASPVPVPGSHNHKGTQPAQGDEHTHTKRSAEAASASDTPNPKTQRVEDLTHL